jgi:hypothetical protein
VVVVPFVPAQLRIGAYCELPPLRVLAGLAVYCLAAWRTRQLESRGRVHLLLAGILFVMHLCVQVQPLGDYTTWSTWLRLDQAGGSELLANVVYRCVYLVFGTAGTAYVAPVTGLLFSLAFLSFVETTFAPRQDAATRVRLVGAAVLACSGWQLLFFRGYLENTQLSLPFLVRAMSAMVELVRRNGGTGQLVKCSAWLTIACLFHGMNVPMFIALVLLVVWCHRHRSMWRLGGQLLVIGVVGAGLVVATVCGLLLTGFEVQAGHVQGGGDGHHFVPFVLAGLPDWYEFAMFDAAHLADVGNLCLLAAPAMVGCVLSPWSRGARRRLLRAVARQPALTIGGLGSASLAAIYYFDLMFPRDYDLMLGMCVPLNLLAVQCAVTVRGAAARWIVATIALGAVHAWAIMGALLVAPTPTPDVAALLEVNRRTGTVHCRAGEWMFLEVVPSTPIAAPFRLQLFTWTGDLPATVSGPAAEPGLQLPRPDDAGAPPGRALRILDKVQGGAADGAFRGDAHFVSGAITCDSLAGTTLLQGLLTDVDGNTLVTNVVRLVCPTR